MQETTEPESPVVLRRPRLSSSEAEEEKLSLNDKISKFNVEQSVSTETEPRQSRPSSSDFSEAFDKQTVPERKQGDSSEQEEQKEKTSRPSSSDYSDIQEKKEMTEKIEPGEPTKAILRQASSSDYSDQQESAKPVRPESSDYSDIFDPINKPEEKDNVDDEPMESIKDRISKFNSGSITSLDREGRQRYPSGSVSSLDKESRIFTSETFGRTIQIEEKIEDTAVQEQVKPVESVKDRVSKFNSGSVTSLDRESDSKPAPRPPSSDYSDILDKKLIFESREADSASARADKVVLAELPVSSISDKINKFTLESAQSSETEPEDESRRSSRPVSSDYSDIFDGRKEAAKETQEDEPMESIKERISKFNSGSVTSLDRESANKFPSRPTSGYSDFGEKKAMFEAPIEETSSSKLSLAAASVTSSETESDMKLPRQSSSEYSDNEEKKDLETKQESVSEKTEEHTDTVKEKSEDDPGNRTDPEDTLARVRSTSQSSSASSNQPEQAIEKSSSDSSDKKSDQELTRQDAFDKAGALRRKQSSSEYSESDVEGRRVESSSDYDSASNRGRKRPDSMISDTSSDYDSLSNVGSRRPQSFVIDDEYDVITEEGETSEKQNKEEETASSSSESEGPDPKEAGKKTKRIPPPGTLKESSGEDDDQDGDDQSTSYPSQIPQPSQSSLASSSSLHVEQSSVSVNVVKSSINNLEESSYMVEEITSATNIETKNMAEIAGNLAEDLALSTSHCSTRQSSSSASSLDLAQKDGSSESGKSQGISHKLNT